MKLLPQKSDFKAKAPNSISAGAPPLTHGERSPDPLAGFKGPILREAERKGDWRGEG